MPRCTYCGRENPDGAASCSECGTALVAVPEPESSVRLSSVMFFLLALFINPFMGAALRNWQSCCLEFSESVAMYLSPFLVLGISARFVPWFAKHPLLGGFLSWGGLSFWCLGAPISCLHALS